jgi:heme exporter protein C
MDSISTDCHGRRKSITGLAILALVLAAIVAIFFVAPTETTMGDVQRIIYLHVSVAWCGLAGAVAMGVFGAIYLVRRRMVWDYWGQSVGEVGWLCATLTLVTGSIWAHEAWGTWWTWEPRLTSSLVLWMIYSGVLLLRSSIEDPQRRARIAAVLAIIGLCDVPLVLMATRWFRGVHPVAPEMEPEMRLVLIISVASMTALFAYLVVLRCRHLKLMELLAQQETRAEFGGSFFLHSSP